MATQRSQMGPFRQMTLGKVSEIRVVATHQHCPIAATAAASLNRMPTRRCASVYGGDSSSIQHVVAGGRKATFSPSPWYLPGTSDATNWEAVYAFDPNSTTTSNMSEAMWRDVLGGEFCLWGEHTDESNIETVAWPRGAAALEVLWSPLAFTGGPSGRSDCVGCDGARQASPRGRRDASAMTAGCQNCHVVDRMRAHACRLKRRGLRPAPENWGWCGTGPSPHISGRIVVH
jgi:hypothetical protein